ncbi:MAG: phosphotransferase [Patescibacteria group bacterium]
MTEFLKNAKHCSIQVPELIRYGKDAENREYMEIREISGSSVTHLKNRERNEAFAMVGGQMLKTNSLFDGYGWLNPETERGDYSSWKMFLTDFFDKYSGKILEPDLAKKLSRFDIRDLIQKIIPNQPETYLIHRDIKPGNLIKDRNGLIWILDWENAILGDPLFDIAQFGANFGHGAQWKALVKGYGLETNCEVYALYEILALIGINVFCQKYEFPKKRKQESFWDKGEWKNLEQK